jgi:hypothetical protein
MSTEAWFNGYTECPACNSKNLSKSYEDIDDVDVDAEYKWSVGCLDCGQTISDGAA